MSDYLWDKSGEADPEVRRLEQLLGSLRHEPAALELPPASAARPARAASRFLRPAALAAAAALALAALVGALVSPRDGGRREAPAATAAGVPAGSETAGSQSSARPEVPGRQNSPAVEGPTGPAAEPGKTGSPAAAGVEVAGSRERRGVGPTRGAAGGRRPVARGGPVVMRGGPADGTRAEGAGREDGGAEVSRAEAKEQLLYALRLASVKLEEVRRLTAGEEGREPDEGPRGRTR